MDLKASKRSSGWRIAFRNKTTNTELDSQRQRSSTQRQSQKTEPNTLENKYGRPHKTISDEGAGGAILLVTRRRDNTTFAVKRFRRRHHYEDEREYSRKIVAEFYIGARLKHTNIIKTLDLFEEHGSWLQVMEYAPECLFDRVMSRKMSTDEINCAFMQILAGANHLHRSGFAHRDLKLENVVTTEKGIMKLIDFGSAILCKEPGRRNATGMFTSFKLTASHQLTKIHTGFVGSLSYMAPEAAAAMPHDPQKADVWSLAIIYACMVLGRFPWKSADRASETFALFAAMELPKTQLLPDPPSRASSTNSVTVINVSITSDCNDKQKVTEKVLGPWGLLRQLPCESRDVIQKMLTINTEKRPTLQHVIDMPWVASSKYCTEEVDGTFCPVDGHRHSG